MSSRAEGGQMVFVRELVRGGTCPAVFHNFLACHASLEIQFLVKFLRGKNDVDSADSRSVTHGWTPPGGGQDATPCLRRNKLCGGDLSIEPNFPLRAAKLGKGTVKPDQRALMVAGGVQCKPPSDLRGKRAQRSSPRCLSRPAHLVKTFHRGQCELPATATARQAGGSSRCCRWHWRH
jgi:hypothetical protein